ALVSHPSYPAGPLVQSAAGNLFDDPPFDRPAPWANGFRSLKSRVSLAATDHSIAMSNVSPDAPMQSLTEQRIVVLDFGSQYAQLIARRVREQNVYCEILRHDVTAERLREIAPRGIILSGGLSSVYAEGAPRCDPGLF